MYWVIAIVVALTALVKFMDGREKKDTYQAIREDRALRPKPKHESEMY